MFHDSEIRYEGREGIRCDLGFHIGDRLYDCRLTSIRESYESYIGYELQFHLHFSLFSHVSHLSEVRGLASTRGEVRIAIASSPTVTEYMFLARTHEIYYHSPILDIRDYRTDWYFEDRIFCSRPMHLLRRSAFSLMCFDHFCVTVSHEGIFIGRSTQYDISTISTISAKRSSIRDIFLTSP